MRIALASLDQIWNEKKANFANCCSIIEKAMSHECQLVIFPEMTLTGYSMDVSRIVEKEADSFTLNAFKNAALNTGINIMYGACLLNPITGNPRNTLCVSMKDSETLVAYSKIHPFTFAGEEKVIEPGDQIGILNIESMIIGLSICYDLRFPELFGAMARKCNAFVNIANWPNRRINHWKSLLIARAIENQCFVIGVNRIGVDGNGIEYKKSSLVVTPDGVLVNPLIISDEVDVYDIDLNETLEYRKSFPTLRDKKIKLYDRFNRNEQLN